MSGTERKREDKGTCLCDALWCHLKRRLIHSHFLKLFIGHTTLFVFGLLDNYHLDMSETRRTHNNPQNDNCESCVDDIDVETKRNNKLIRGDRRT